MGSSPDQATLPHPHNVRRGKFVSNFCVQTLNDERPSDPKTFLFHLFPSVVTYGICYEDHLKKEMGRETEGMQKKGRK
jgi:hypothetical protein